MAVHGGGNQPIVAGPRSTPLNHTVARGLGAPTPASATAPPISPPVHARSGSTDPTTPTTVTFSGARSNPTPYVPSTQPIYVPRPATTTPAVSSASNGLPRYEAATSAQPGSLAYTGRDTRPLVVAGGGAVLAGLVLVALSRRRPDGSRSASACG